MNQVLNIDGAPLSVTAPLCYGLQGRARTCASFIDHLFRPGSAALQPGVVLHEVLMDVYEDFMSKLVIPRVIEELQSMQLLPRWNPDFRDVGLLICLSPLATLQHSLDFANTSNCMAFTKRVIEISAAEAPPVQMKMGVQTSSQIPLEGAMEDDGQVLTRVRYRYEYQFASPVCRKRC